ncbi:MAG: patatin-like phospholipase family protein [Myxococcota bacterium]
MGLTLIRKSPEGRRKRKPKVALVLAGGAVSGGAFKVGGLKALNDFLVGRKITDFDLYVGLSAGSILAVSLAGKVPPDEMIKVLEGTSGQLEQLRPLDFYHPNWQEAVTRPAKFGYDLVSYLPGVAWEFLESVPKLRQELGPSLRAFVRKPSYANAEGVAMELLEMVSPSREVPAFTNHLPTGFFENSSIEGWLARNIQRMRMPNDFRAFERKAHRGLYITACDLDTAERVIFGPDENCELSISQAVQASTALPIFYKPARINGVDYMDGGIRHTANIDIAIEKGADLIICYNPFRPFLNRIDADGTGDDRYFASGRYLSDRGLKVVINQVFRTLLHSRLKLGLQRYLADERFQGDIVLLEPREEEADFFAINPLAFWKRAESIRHGFNSVRVTIEQNFSQLQDLFSRYGLVMDRAQAERKAAALRSRKGWKISEAEREAREDDSSPLRLVARRTA